MPATEGPVDTVGGPMLLEATVDVGSIAASAVVEATATFAAGLLDPANDLVVVLAPAALETGLQIGSAYVASATTVKFRLANHTAGAIDPASRAYQLLVFRR